MADVTVKAYAELIHTPLHGQMRILREHKYPKQTDGQFRIPYYQPAIRHIRKYFQSGNDPIHLPVTANDLRGAGQQQTKIDHNLRVISAFRNGSQSKRQCVLQPPVTYSLILGQVNIRATADIIVVDNAAAVPKYLLLDCREAHLRPEEEIIRTTVKLFHYTLSNNGIQIPVRNVEYICLDGDIVHRWTSLRQTTINRANGTAVGIDALWKAI